MDQDAGTITMPIYKGIVGGSKDGENSTEMYYVRFLRGSGILCCFAS